MGDYLRHHVTRLCNVSSLKPLAYFLSRYGCMFSEAVIREGSHTKYVFVHPYPSATNAIIIIISYVTFENRYCLTMLHGQIKII